MVKKIKKNRFAAIITRDAEGITVRADYIVECDDCGEAKQKSLERTPPPAKRARGNKMPHKGKNKDYKSTPKHPKKK